MIHCNETYLLYYGALLLLHNLTRIYCICKDDTTLILFSILALGPSVYLYSYDYYWKFYTICVVPNSLWWFSADWIGGHTYIHSTTQEAIAWVGNFKKKLSYGWLWMVCPLVEWLYWVTRGGVGLVHIVWRVVSWVGGANSLNPCCQPHGCCLRGQGTPLMS